jgi:hypothetical protein
MIVRTARRSASGLRRLLRRRVASRSGRPDRQCGTPSTTETLAAARARAAAPPLRSSIAADPNLQHLEPPQLAIAHQLNRHPKHPRDVLGAVSSLIGRRVTFLIGRLQALSMSHKRHSGKVRRAGVSISEAGPKVREGSQDLRLCANLIGAVGRSSKDWWVLRLSPSELSTRRADRTRSAAASTIPAFAADAVPLQLHRHQPNEAEQSASMLSTTSVASGRTESANFRSLSGGRIGVRGPSSSGAPPAGLRPVYRRFCDVRPARGEKPVREAGVRVWSDIPSAARSSNCGSMRRSPLLHQLRSKPFKLTLPSIVSFFPQCTSQCRE